jgi:hypothetical protein
MEGMHQESLWNCLLRGSQTLCDDSATIYTTGSGWLPLRMCVCEDILCLISKLCFRHEQRDGYDGARVLWYNSIDRTIQFDDVKCSLPFLEL